MARQAGISTTQDAFVLLAEALLSQPLAGWGLGHGRSVPRTEKFLSNRRGVSCRAVKELNVDCRPPPPAGSAPPRTAISSPAGGVPQGR